MQTDSASNPGESLARVTTIILNVFETAGLFLMENETETMLPRGPNQAPLTSPLAIDAAGQGYIRTVQSVYHSGHIN